MSVIDWLVFEALGLDPGSRLGGAVHFFLYDSVKIFLLLAGMIFLIGVARTWLPESKIRQWMGRGGIWANVVAALFGAVTPFCSCSSIPIFISFLKARVPLGVAFSFLITSPIVNEYLVVLMAAEFGLPVTLVYVASGLVIGTLTGALLGRCRLEAYLESDIVASTVTGDEDVAHTWKTRIRAGWNEALDVIRRIWAWVLVGVGVGAVIHNYVPRESIESAMAATGAFSVPLATLLGVPMYGSCAAIVPVAVALFEKGIPLGTALAFMMAMAALSFPEAIMLRRAMHLKLIAIFFGITALAIVATGYLLNLWAALFLAAG